MSWLLNLLELRALSRVHMSLYYRQILWIGATVLIPMAVLGVIAVRTVEDEMIRQAQSKVVSDLNVAAYLFGSKGSDVRVVDGKMVVAGNYVVNGNYEVVDHVTHLVGGTATIFQGDTRISTTVKKDDGSRAVGTQAAANVVDAVLKQGQRYVGRAWVVNAWYITAYDPIKDPSGKIIGMLYVGTPEKPYTDASESFRNRTLLVGLLGLLLALFMGWMNARYLSKPVAQMTAAASAMAEGDVGREMALDEERGDELGEMAAAFRRMVTYVQRMADAAGRIAAGDLTVEVAPVSSRDVLANAFGDMVADLRQVVGEVAHGAEQVTRSSGGVAESAERIGASTQQIAQTMQQVAKGNEEQARGVSDASAFVGKLSQSMDQVARDAVGQAADVNRVSEAVGQILASVQEVTKRSADLGRASEQAKRAAQDGGTTVRRTVEGMHTITDAVEGSAVRIQELGRRSGEIGQIVEAIDDIAAQTNLLALNAAIEAARAGEHGRGFAVVAEEVRKLAERSSRSTREIAELIGAVQKDTAEAVEAMSRGAAEVEQGRGLADAAGKALEEISGAVAEAAGQVERIAAAAEEMRRRSEEASRIMAQVSEVVERNVAASREVAKDSEQATRATENVAAVAEENSAATQEVTASAEETRAQVVNLAAASRELAAMARRLQEAVGRFQLES